MAWSSQPGLQSGWMAWTQIHVRRAVPGEGFNYFDIAAVRWTQKKPAWWPAMFVDIWTIKKTNVFSRCTYRLLFRLMHQLALHVRFPTNRTTLIGLEHAPTETSRRESWPRPQWSFAKFRGRSSLATPLIGFGAHSTWPYIHPAVSRRALLALGSRWPSCIPCPRPIL